MAEISIATHWEDADHYLYLIVFSRLFVRRWVRHKVYSGVSCHSPIILHNVGNSILNAGPLLRQQSKADLEASEWRSGKRFGEKRDFPLRLFLLNRLLFFFFRIPLSGTKRFTFRILTTRQ